MSLDITLTETRPVEVHSQNITHNLVTMAEEAALYGVLWRPEENGIKRAGQLIPHLEAGIEKMKANPEHFRAFNPKNGWGSYDAFLPWLNTLLDACHENPNAEVSACR